MPLRSRQKSAWGEAWAIICPSEQRPQLRQILAFSSKSGRSIVNQKAKRIPKWETSASADVQKFDRTLLRKSQKPIQMSSNVRFLTISDATSLKAQFLLTICKRKAYVPLAESRNAQMSSDVRFWRFSRRAGFIQNGSQ